MWSMRHAKTTPLDEFLLLVVRNVDQALLDALSRGMLWTDGDPTGSCCS